MQKTFNIDGKDYWVSSFRGTVKGLHQWSETSVSGGGGGGGVTYEGTGVTFGPNSVTSSTTRHCEFFVSDGKSEERFKVMDLDTGMREGHEVSVAWVGRAGASKGHVALIHNHTTGEHEHLLYAIDATLGAGIKILGMPIPNRLLYLLWFFPVGSFFVALPIAGLLGLVATPLGVIGYIAVYLGAPFALWRRNKARKAANRAAMVAALDAAV